jgi:hypothetical protein
MALLEQTMRVSGPSLSQAGRLFPVELGGWPFRCTGWKAAKPSQSRDVGIYSGKRTPEGHAPGVADSEDWPRAEKQVQVE